ncbi:MAG: hypothetical protein V7739_11950 [Motiliproteus sp.]
MQRTPYYYDEYQAATALRAQVQAEQLTAVVAFLKGFIKSKVPAFGPLYNSTNYSMCMRARDKRSTSV